MTKVKENSKVKVHYTGTLENGEVFDSSREREPLEFTMGQGQLIPGFEKAVLGLEKGQSTKVTIPVEEAYGEKNPDLVQTVNKSELPAEIKPEVGMQLVSRTPDGHEIPVTITEVTEETFTVDANHPLAGKALTFDIEVMDIEE
jgi:FKBP-type peptidyl-prolyl cis-trans isomerase 2